MRFIVKMLSVAAMCLSLALTSPAQTTLQSQSGGVANFPTTVGSSITITDMTLTDGHLATFTCPVLSFAASTYQWNWVCGNGNVKTSDGLVSPVLGGKVTLNCQGGGRAHPTTCLYVGNGEFSDPSGIIGSFTFKVTGVVNNKPKSVLSFYASWTDSGITQTAPSIKGLTTTVKPLFVNPACYPNVSYYTQWRLEWANGWAGPAFYWGWQYYDSCTNQAINWFVPLVLFG